MIGTMADVVAVTVVGVTGGYRWPMVRQLGRVRILMMGWDGLVEDVFRVLEACLRTTAQNAKRRDGLARTRLAKRVDGATVPRSYGATELGYRHMEHMIIVTSWSADDHQPIHVDIV